MYNVVVSSVMNNFSVKIKSSLIETSGVERNSKLAKVSTGRDKNLTTTIHLPRNSYMLNHGDKSNIQISVWTQATGKFVFRIWKNYKDASIFIILHRYTP